MATKKSKKKSSGHGLGMAAAIIGAAAAGFYLYGSKGKENRIKVKAWTLKAKAEVLEKFENSKQQITDEKYAEVVDKVTSKYAKMKTVGEVEAMKLNRELKRHWNAIKRSAQEKPGKKK